MKRIYWFRLFVLIFISLILAACSAPLPENEQLAGETAVSPTKVTPLISKEPQHFPTHPLHHFIAEKGSL